MENVKFAVFDWAGNRLYNFGVHTSFEDAWDSIYEYFDHLDGEEFDLEMGEYDVLPVKD